MDDANDTDDRGYTGTIPIGCWKFSGPEQAATPRPECDTCVVRHPPAGDPGAETTWHGLQPLTRPAPAQTDPRD